MDAYDFRALCYSAAFATETQYSSYSYDIGDSPAKRQLAFMLRGEVSSLLEEVIYSLINEFFEHDDEKELSISSDLFKSKACDVFKNIIDKRAERLGVPVNQLDNKNILGSAFGMWGVFVSSKLNDMLGIKEHGDVSFPSVEELFGETSPGL